MNWQTVIGGGWLVVCVMLGFALPVAIAADSTCSDTAACAPLDEDSAGDNQNGDAGADREPPDDKKNG
jgi:hypothetical protein